MTDPIDSGYEAILRQIYSGVEERMAVETWLATLKLAGASEETSEELKETLLTAAIFKAWSICDLILDLVPEVSLGNSNKLYDQEQQPYNILAQHAPQLLAGRLNHYFKVPPSVQPLIATKEEALAYILDSRFDPTEMEHWGFSSVHALFEDPVSYPHYLELFHKTQLPSRFNCEELLRQLVVYYQAPKPSQIYQFDPSNLIDIIYFIRAQSVDPSRGLYAPNYHSIYLDPILKSAIYALIPPNYNVLELVNKQSQFLEVLPDYELENPAITLALLSTLDLSENPSGNIPKSNFEVALNTFRSSLSTNTVNALKAAQLRKYWSRSKYDHIHEFEYASFLCFAYHATKNTAHWTDYESLIATHKDTLKSNSVDFAKELETQLDFSVHTCEFLNYIIQVEMFGPKVNAVASDNLLASALIYWTKAQEAPNTQFIALIESLSGNYTQALSSRCSTSAQIQFLRIQYAPEHALNALSTKNEHLFKELLQTYKPYIDQEAVLWATITSGYHQLIPAIQTVFPELEPRIALLQRYLTALPIRRNTFTRE